MKSSLSQRKVGKIARTATAIAASAALAIALTGCSGQSTQAQKDDNVSLLIKVPTLTFSTPLNEEITTSYEFLVDVAEAYTEEHPNVDISVVEFEIADEQEELSVTIGTPEAPDLLYEGYFNMSTYIHSGTVVPLDDIISDELRADIPESFWESSQLNGKTYMMPFLHMQNTLCVNTDMLKDAGLSSYVPADFASTVQTWTLEDWDKVLAALKTSLPDTSYPMMMYAGDNQGDTHIMTLLRSRGCDFYGEDDRFAINTPEGVEALQWIKDSYDAGYFPRGAESLVINDNYQLFVNGMEGVFMNNITQDVPLSEESDFEYMSVNFPAPDGGLATSFITGFEVFDNGDDAKVAAAKDFVKFIYESDFIDYSIAGIPVSDSVAEKYASQLTREQKFIDNSDAVWNFTGNHPNWRDVRAVFYKHIADLLFGSATPEEVAFALDEDCNAAIDAGYAVSKLHD